ncbi:cytochrome C oxidase subunit IV family protein [Hyphomicrobium sp.]|uniref:cytochrome C oxidase subunit IV family protein n=1 Tax=Hyphomicrobium sp. TaxID=82 RepID=UPI002E3781EB|nr:cytochrome C oxidase subunit IV family protein [Hyphomicrobium sp.]HEX2842345.1 cytochrome C oxidase subunit IV family protein [Hyphomicrobium sp.]
MPARDLIEAWGSLVALSIGTVLIASVDASGKRGTLAAAGVLTLAGIKARVILARYLGLSGSRFWTRTFDLAIGIFLALAFGLYTFGSGN